MFVSALILPAVMDVQAKKPRAKVKGNALPVLKDPKLMNMGKHKNAEDLFLVIGLNFDASQDTTGSTVYSVQTTGQQKFFLVKSFLMESGLKVLKAFPDLSSIWVEGSEAVVESAFQVSINHYRLGNKDFFAADDDPSVPLDIVDYIGAVAGLENYVTFEPSNVMASSASPNAKPAAEVVGPPYDPYEIRSAYDFNTFYTKAHNLTGKGINVAIIDAYGNPNMNADYPVFCTGTQNGGAGPWQGGALPKTPAISYFYPAGKPVSKNLGWAMETAMDVEWVHAVAPGAKINLVISKTASFANMLATFQWTVTNKKGAVISMSFGANEVTLPAGYAATWGASSRAAVKSGIAMMASTGDYGSDSWRIQHPASDPYTLAVGGTELATAGAYPGVYFGESAWSGSGGGQSIIFPKPAWQFGLNVPLDSVRDTPDVSLVADPNTGAYVYGTGAGMLGWYEVGGTSLAAPLWAAFMALVDQGLGASASTGGLGLVSPWLYRVFRSADYANCFHDIVNGNNGGWAAGTAYDMVTGIGTLDAWNLFNLGAQYMRMPLNITYIPGAKAIAVSGTGTMYIGTFNRVGSWPYQGILYELEKGSTAPRALFNAGGGITDIAVDKNGKVYVMTYNKLYKYDPLATAPVTTLVSGLTWGWGVDVDTNLNVYYTNDADASGNGTGGLYWIKAGGAPARLKAVSYPIGVCVDTSSNIYVTVGGLTMMMNAAHTTWTQWKTLGSLDIDLDTRKTSYHSYFTAMYLMDDYPLLLTSTHYDENLWLDSKTGIYYVNWEAGYGLPPTGGWVMYLPPEKPT